MVGKSKTLMNLRRSGLLLDSWSWTPALDGVWEGSGGDYFSPLVDPVSGELPVVGGHSPGDLRGVELVLEGEVVPHVDVGGGAEVDHYLGEGEVTNGDNDRTLASSPSSKALAWWAEKVAAVWYSLTWNGCMA